MGTPVAMSDINRPGVDSMYAIAESRLHELRRSNHKSTYGYQKKPIFQGFLCYFVWSVSFILCFHASTEKYCAGSAVMVVSGSNVVV